MREGQRELVRMRFGLIPFFAKGVPGQYSTINARVETVRTSPAYRTAWNRGQRCLVIASGFYEWQVVGEGKQPWYVSCADQPVFGFAGLWDRSVPEGGEPILSCTIITLPASPFMAQIHNTKLREPAILQRNDHGNLAQWHAGGGLCLPGVLSGRTALGLAGVEAREFAAQQRREAYFP